MSTPDARAALSSLREKVAGMDAPVDTDGAEMVGTLDRAAVIAEIDRELEGALT